MPEPKPVTIHVAGVLLFLFIPLVLFLFLRFPWGILPSFTAALVVMFSHRFAAIPFMNRFRSHRCLWCGRTGRERTVIPVRAGKLAAFQFCTDRCGSNALRFFDFCMTYKNLLRPGIFLPLAWYVATMLMSGVGILDFPVEWNRFIFQFGIACSVVSVSFLYGKGKETDQPSFAFPIHNLFLLGIRNTLVIFRYVGIWWIAASLYFLYGRFVA